ncbi:MAG TPA: hypothetical protein VNN79_15440 [Actinomycetota bacterium]|nr:hypothetical protein [Actinomycetota bacterium]
MTFTGSRKIDRIVAQAEALGLAVDVKVEDHESSYLPTQRSVSVQIKRPHVEVQNALDLYRNSQGIHLFFVWYREIGATPRMAIATQHSMGCEHTLTSRTVPFAISSLAE